MTLQSFVVELRNRQRHVHGDEPDALEEVLDAVIRAAEGDWRPLDDLTA